MEFSEQIDTPGYAVYRLTPSASVSGMHKILEFIKKSETMIKLNKIRFNRSV